MRKEFELKLLGEVFDVLDIRLNARLVGKHDIVLFNISKAYENLLTTDIYDKLVEMKGHVNPSVFAWVLDKSYEALDDTMSTLFGDEDMRALERTTKLEKLGVDVSDINEINKFAREILSKRGWIDENDSIKPLYLKCAEKYCDCDGE